MNAKHKVYVASSWRNKDQPQVVAAIAAAGHEVYDFQHPDNYVEGFSWEEIDYHWRSWSPERYMRALLSPQAELAFGRDFEAMEWADTFVLVQPCGRSAHLEMGWAVGQNKLTIMMLGESIEPELMVKLCDHVSLDLNEVLNILNG